MVLIARYSRPPSSRFNIDSSYRLSRGTIHLLNRSASMPTSSFKITDTFPVCSVRTTHCSIVPLQLHLFLTTFDHRSIISTKHLDYNPKRKDATPFIDFDTLLKKKGSKYLKALLQSHLFYVPARVQHLPSDYRSLSFSINATLKS